MANLQSHSDKRVSGYSDTPAASVCSCRRFFDLRSTACGSVLDRSVAVDLSSGGPRHAARRLSDRGLRSGPRAWCNSVEQSRSPARSPSRARGEGPGHRSSARVIGFAAHRLMEMEDAGLTGAANATPDGRGADGRCPGGLRTRGRSTRSRSLRHMYGPTRPVGRYRSARARRCTRMVASRRRRVILSGTTYQELAANAAEAQGGPLAALHYFPVRANNHILPIRLPPSLVESLWSVAKWSHWRLLRPAYDEQRRVLRLPDSRIRAVRRIVESGALEIQAYDKVFFPDSRRDGTGRDHWSAP